MNQPLQACDERFITHALGEEYHPWLGAELARTDGDGRMQPTGDGIRFFPQSARQNENRIGAAHLGKDWNGIGPRSRYIHKRPASVPRSGKSDRLHEWMPDQRDAHLVAGIK